MQNDIHFISGLPRSGSTLLSALLLQNPRCHAGVSSIVFQIVSTLQTALSARNEFHVFIDDRKREAMLRGAVANYYADIEPGKIVFDTNRGWCSKLAILDRLFPRAKIICCVRSVAWILDSIERLQQRNALEPSRIFNFEATGNVYTRAELLNALTGLVGGPYGALKEAYFGEFSHKLVLVNYESLAKRPAETMAALSEFLGISPFEHRFDSVEFQAPTYDIELGTPGLHTVRKDISFVARQSILPPDLFRRYERSAFWQQPSNNPKNVRII